MLPTPPQFQPTNQQWNQQGCDIIIRNDSHFHSPSSHVIASATAHLRHGLSCTPTCSGGQYGVPFVNQSQPPGMRTLTYSALFDTSVYATVGNDPTDMRQAPTKYIFQGFFQPNPRRETSKPCPHGTNSSANAGTGHLEGVGTRGDNKMVPTL